MPNHRIQSLVGPCMLIGVFLFAVRSHAQESVCPPEGSRPLRSWNDTASSKAIVAFVNRVTDADSADFVPVNERIAVFDNDGTISVEAPFPAQAAFAFDELARLSPRHPEWKNDPQLAPAIKRDFAALHAQGTPALLKIFAETHAGITTDEFQQRGKRWLSKAKHPRFDRPYHQCVYQPMIEVIRYLRANDFKVFVVSGGGADFMRLWMEPALGIPPEQIVGSTGRVTYKLGDSGPVLTKTLEHLFVDDHAGKPVGIHQFIGRRPIIAFGNSDGDQAMLEYTTIKNARPSLGLIVHHTDADREYAYDAKPPASGKLTTALAQAPRRGWVVIDMKKDWKSVFPPKEN